MAIKPPIRVALDLETTGLYAEQDAILEIAAIKFQGATILDKMETLISPGRSIPSQRHGRRCRGRSRCRSAFACPRCPRREWRRSHGPRTSPRAHAPSRSRGSRLGGRPGDQAQVRHADHPRCHVDRRAALPASDLDDQWGPQPFDQLLQDRMIRPPAL